MKEETIKKLVKREYGKIAQNSLSRTLPCVSCCTTLSKEIGYREEDLTSAPQGANLGLGCGNPVAIASLKEGDTVVDLGCGAGFDCFLAAKAVGENGRVIGVDMTLEMIEKARENARKGNYPQVEFRLGEIESLPIGDNTADVVISNCVINLSPNKEKAFAEAFRILKPSGQLHVSDLVLNGNLPTSIKGSIEAYIGCVAGAVKKEAYLAAIKKAGFENILIVKELSYPLHKILSSFASSDIIGEELQITSIHISAQKP